MVPSRLRLLICLAAASIFFAACSSTTVVARDDRVTADTAQEAATQDVASEALDDDPIADTSEDPQDADDGTSTEVDSEGDDDSRGGRNDTPVARDVAEGFGLGGAEQLQSLLVDCQDGNDLACDILFTISAFDSDEENVAITCGGRSDTAVTFCTAGIDAGEDDLVFDPDSAGLERIIEACQVDGNMTACDFLYYRSPVGSEFEEIGDTCGGRVNVAVPDCRSIIGE